MKWHFPWLCWRWCWCREALVLINSVRNWCSKWISFEFWRNTKIRWMVIVTKLVSPSNQLASNVFRSVFRSKWKQRKCVSENEIVNQFCLMKLDSSWKDSRETSKENLFTSARQHAFNALRQFWDLDVQHHQSGFHLVSSHRAQTWWGKFQFSLRVTRTNFEDVIANESCANV